MRSYLLLLSLCWLTKPLTGQPDALRPVELGLNITQTLAGFFNSGGQNGSADPYLFSLKVIGPRGVFRTGLNFKHNNRQEFASTGQRDILEQNFYLRAGWEKRIPVSSRFTVYWGLDGVMRYESERVEFATFNGDKLKLNDYNLGFGGGPVLGLLFHLNPRVSLSTEGTLYGLYYRGKDEQSLDPGQPGIRRDVEGIEILPMAPSSLYLIFSF